MLSSQGIVDKLYELPNHFEIHMQNKNYSRAKSCYDTARTVALFTELKEEELEHLFGSRQREKEIIGMFPEEKVQKAYWECIKKNETYENKKYEPIKK